MKDETLFHLSMMKNWLKSWLPTAKQTTPVELVEVEVDEGDWSPMTLDLFDAISCNLEATKQSTFENWNYMVDHTNGELDATVLAVEKNREKMNSIGTLLS